ncbi:D-tyrosyl-tRNA(Tyr) deacylase [Malassezia caprae]|uniref:D-aminoacyl-tRNA deacylase n=1 Tax=Malassezia caprae TaxID=1381934 RepID=A0AAF0E589_9BASI|nr:D-tyrosyl-tRNA(Tyr) deacylase [Malassezia caprae]
MRAVLQRVKQASVHGILALVGITHEDAAEQADMLVKRILTTKLWPEGAKIEKNSIVASQDARSWRESVTELGGEVLCGTFARVTAVSQFTLYAKMKGTKPDFHSAMGGDKAQPFYHEFLTKLRDAYAADKIKGTPWKLMILDGQFGAMMDVSLVNDGA